MRRVSFALVLTASALLACGKSVASSPDADTLGKDSGASTMDSGPPTKDAHAANVDSSSPAFDSGAPALDTLFIQQVFLPTIPSNGSCTYTADPTEMAMSTGEIDVSFSSLDTYTPEFLVANADDASVAVVHGAVTRITDTGGNDVPTMFSNMCTAGDAVACTVSATAAKSPPTNPFSTVETATIAPASGDVPSYATMSITIVDATTVSLLSSYFAGTFKSKPAAAFSTKLHLVTYTRLAGMDLHGASGDSAPYEFPVTVGFGELLENLTQCEGASCPSVGYCLASEMVPDEAQACVPGQDAPIIVTPTFLPGLACPDADAGG